MIHGKFNIKGNDLNSFDKDWKGLMRLMNKINLFGQKKVMEANYVRMPKS